MVERQHSKLGTVAHAFNPRRGKMISASWRPAWSTQCAPRQPGACRDLASKINRRNFKRGSMINTAASGSLQPTPCVFADMILEVRKWALLLPPFYRRGSWSSGRLRLTVSTPTPAESEWEV